MQGTPAHLEYLTSKDKRRHMARCSYYIKEGKVCDCPKSGYFREKCGGSSHCKYYKER